MNSFSIAKAKRGGKNLSLAFDMYIYIFIYLFIYIYEWLTVRIHATLLEVNKLTNILILFFRHHPVF